jgi:glycosyltransferase involved in cell wall biosynthesis
MLKIPQVLILTPVKNAEGILPNYFRQLSKLSYPKHAISLGFLESDSHDGTYEYLQNKLEELNQTYLSAKLWKRDYQFSIPAGMHRHEEAFQLQRRIILAKSRNQLLFRALEHHDWVLWLDVDVISYPKNIIQQLLQVNKDIVHPNCVKEYNGKSYDLNAWRNHGKLHLHDLKAEGDLVALDSVGGTMLLVKGDVHRDGLIFPPFTYGLTNPKARQEENLWQGEVETEGLGIMANDMGVSCWGMPHLEIKHSKY